MRKAQAEIVGVIITIPVLVGLFIVGSSLLQQNIHQMELVNQKMRENLVVIPIYYNDTLYAKVINVGPRPVLASYIILYQLVNDTRQLATIKFIDEEIPPGANTTLPIASNLTSGKYEVNIVTRLGNVFGWDPSIGGAYSIPPEDAVLQDNPLLLLSDLIDPGLAKEILENYTVVGYDAVKPVLYDTSIFAQISGTSNYRPVTLSIRVNGTINHYYYKHVTNSKIIHEYTGTVDLTENMSAQLYVYGYLWGYGRPYYSTGIRLRVDYTLIYEGSRPILVTFNLNKLDNVIVPVATTYKNVIGEVSLDNGTLLSYYDNRYVVLLYGPGRITLEYMTWRTTSPTSPNGGSWTAQLEGIVSYTGLNVVYLDEK